MARHYALEDQAYPCVLSGRPALFSSSSRFHQIHLDIPPKSLDVRLVKVDGYSIIYSRVKTWREIKLSSIVRFRAIFVEVRSHSSFRGKRVPSVSNRLRVASVPFHDFVGMQVLRKAIRRGEEKLAILVGSKFSTAPLSRNSATLILNS